MVLRSVLRYNFLHKHSQISTDINIQNTPLCNGVFGFGGCFYKEWNSFWYSFKWCESKRQGSLHIWFSPGFMANFSVTHKNTFAPCGYLPNHRIYRIRATSAERKNVAIFEVALVLETVHFICTFAHSPRGNSFYMRAVECVAWIGWQRFFRSVCHACHHGIEAWKVQKVTVINKQQRTNRLGHIKTWCKCNSTIF